MIITVCGGSGSGKSAFAESLAHSLCKAQKVYIATMQPFDDEAYARIEKHRKMRQNKGFETVEKYTALSELVLYEGATVLLDCISNLMANEVFSQNGGGVNAVLQGVDSLCRQAENIVFVTNDIFCDGLHYDSQTCGYMSQLSQVNKYLLNKSDIFVEVIYGIPLCHKGDLEELYV